MILFALVLVALFGIGPVAAVFLAFGALGEWCAVIPVAYLVACLFD
jgi:hypothetical protein